MFIQTIGMAVMLDEIINYVQSLQNQVEVSEWESLIPIIPLVTIAN